MKKSKGITIFGTLILIYSIFSAANSGGSFFSKILNLSSTGTNLETVWKSLLSDSFFLIVAVSLAFFSKGIMDFKEWGRKGVVICSMLLFISIILAIIHDYFVPTAEGMNIFPIWFHVLFLAIFLSPTWYFNLRNVKEQFK